MANIYEYQLAFDKQITELERENRRLSAENTELRRHRERLPVAWRAGSSEGWKYESGPNKPEHCSGLWEPLYSAMSEQPAAATCQCAVSCIRANGGDVLNLDGSPKICRGLPGDNHPMRWHNRQPAAKESNHG